MNWSIAIQISLAGFGLTAMALALGNSQKGRRWAPIVGLAGQPAWLAFSWRTQALGLGLLSIAYSLVYVRGIYNQWLNQSEAK